MDLSTFLHDRRPSWKRLEELLERAEGSGLACLNEDEAVEFGNLYRRTASDLNQAQTFVSGDATVRYLNDLVGAGVPAHLRQDAASTWRGMADVPRLRAGRPCSAATCRISCWPRPVRLRRGLRLPGVVLRQGRRPAIPPADGHADHPAARGGPERPHAANVTPAISAPSPCSFSRTTPPSRCSPSPSASRLGVGTVWFMFENGLMLGVLGAVFWDAEVHHPGHGYFLTFITGIVPHGVLELPACLIGGAAGLVLAQGMIRGQAVAAPRGDGPRSARRRFCWCPGPCRCWPWRACWRPASPALRTCSSPAWLKLTVACVFAVLFLAYTLLLGWGKNPYYRRDAA